MKLFKRVLVVFLMCCSVFVWADSFKKKKGEAAQKKSKDENYFVIGVMPNNSGDVDGYLSAQLFFSSRLLSWIEVESTSSKKASQNNIPGVDLMLEADASMERNINVKADLLRYRFINFKSKKSFFAVSLTPYFGYQYSYLENKRTTLDEAGSTVDYNHDEYTFHFFQANLKANITFKHSKQFAVQLYGGGGAFFGSMAQEFLFYNFDGFAWTKEPGKSDSNFLSPGISFGGKIYTDFGPIALRVEGYYLMTNSKLDFFWNDGSVNDGMKLDFRYRAWHFRAEIVLKFVKIGKAMPALFYSMSDSRFEVDDPVNGFINLLARYDAEAKESNLVHKFGVTMRF